jgi:hypothetical protein
MTLHIRLKDTMNALFIRDLAAKTLRGLRGRVAAGKSAGGLSYGYKPIRRIDERATRWRPCPRLMLTFRCWIRQVIRGHAVHAVFLHLAWRDLVQGQIPEERNETYAQSNGVALGPLLAALTFRDDAIFFDELVGRLLEGRADVVKDACTQAPWSVEYHSSAALLASSCSSCFVLNWRCLPATDL